MTTHFLLILSLGFVFSFYLVEIFVLEVSFTTNLFIKLWKMLNVWRLLILL